MKTKIDIFTAVEKADPHGIAIECLILAEEEYMRGEVDPESESEFTQMCYKDDDGNWRVTDSKRIYKSFEELCVDYPEFEEC